MSVFMVLFSYFCCIFIGFAVANILRTRVGIRELKKIKKLLDSIENGEQNEESMKILEDIQSKMNIIKEFEYFAFPRKK